MASAAAPFNFADPELAESGPGWFPVNSLTWSTSVMNASTITAGALLLVLGASPVLASPCLDRITALEPRVNEASETTASVSSGGQGVAAAREGQAMQARNAAEPITPPTVPPFQNQAREAQTTREAAAAGGGGDRVMQARAMLNQARAHDQKGESAACLDAIAQAEGHLGRR